jgi:hypothetical protein
VIANTGQCGAPTFPAPTSVDFILNKNPGCMRNQMNPDDGRGLGVYRLTPGATYTWTFQTVTHMGIDTGHLTQRLVWQIHDYITNGSICSPLTVLGIQNFTGTQVWYLQSGNGTWTGAYTEGATDNWVISLTMSTSGTGHITASRNGVQIVNGSGATYNTCSSGGPWWNFGPYMWDWTNHNAVSSLTSVEILFNSMVLTSGS